MEAYLGFVARAIVGHASYKSDDAAKQTPERRATPARILEALVASNFGLPGGLEPLEGWIVGVRHA